MFFYMSMFFWSVLKTSLTRCIIYMPKYSRECTYLCVIMWPCIMHLKHLCAEIHTGCHVRLKLKVPLGSFATTCLKIKMVIFSPNAPRWVHGEEGKCFRRPPPVLVTAPSLCALFSSISREITEQRRQLPDSHSCMVCVGIFVFWCVWQVCTILWQCLTLSLALRVSVCVCEGESVCVCVCVSVRVEQTKFCEAQLNKDSLSTNLFDTILKFCLSLCHTSTAGKKH